MSGLRSRGRAARGGGVSGTACLGRGDGAQGFPTVVVIVTPGVVVPVVNVRLAALLDPRLLGGVARIENIVRVAAAHSRCDCGAPAERPSQTKSQGRRQFHLLEGKESFTPNEEPVLAGVFVVLAGRDEVVAEARCGVAHGAYTAKREQGIWRRESGKKRCLDSARAYSSGLGFVHEITKAFAWDS